MQVELGDLTYEERVAIALAVIEEAGGDGQVLSLLALLYWYKIFCVAIALAVMEEAGGDGQVLSLLYFTGTKILFFLVSSSSATASAVMEEAGGDGKVLSLLALLVQKYCFF